MTASPADATGFNTPHNTPRRENLFAARRRIIIGSPKMPAVPTVPPPPPLPPAISTSQVQGASTSYRNNAAGAAGLNSTILTGPMGADQGVNYPGKALTGQ